MTSPAATAPADPADQRIERDLALEQPRDLVVGRADAVHHLDRRAVRVERAARGKHHRRGGCQRDQHHQRRAPARSAREAPQQRREAVAMRDEARARHRRARSRGDRRRVGARREVDVDHRRQRQVGVGAGRAEPALERPAQLLSADLGDRGSPRRAARAAAIAAGSLGRAVGDLDRIAILDARFDQPRRRWPAPARRRATTTMTNIMIAITHGRRAAQPPPGSAGARRREARQPIIAPAPIAAARGGCLSEPVGSTSRPFSSRISCAPGVAAIRPRSWVATMTVVPSRFSAVSRWRMPLAPCRHRRCRSARRRRAVRAGR